jgi:hypothetical protein
MVTTPKPRPRPTEHNESECLCGGCKRVRSQLRRRGHYAPEPHWPKSEHPNLEAEIAEMFGQ